MMKPSEKRALQAEKRRLEEERKTTPADEPGSGSKSGADEESREGFGGSISDFFQSHVRLITFIITSLVVLVLLSPMGIDLLISKRSNTVDDKEDMTIDTVYAVHDNGENMKWQHFKKYNYTDHSYDTKKGKYIVREYPIKDSRLVLKVGGLDGGKAIDYAQLIDYKTGEFLDVLKQDPHSFIKSIEQEEEK